MESESSLHQQVWLKVEEPSDKETVWIWLGFRPSDCGWLFVFGEQLINMSTETCYIQIHLTYYMSTVVYCLNLQVCI